MKTAHAAVRNAIRTSHDVKAKPRLVAEWNLNRYREAVIDNTPSEETAGHDIDMFPIESIVEPLRPSKGINKARVNASVIADKYITINTPRFYVAGLEDKYKYWVSPYPSDSQGNITGVAPRVIYSRTVRTNKIVVGVENTWATPVAWSIQITEDGSTWRTAVTNPAVGNDGRAVVYWNGSNWSSNKPATPAADTTILGMRVLVTKLGPGRTTNGAITRFIRNGVASNTSGANSYFSLIEISARLEKELTSDLMSVSDTFDAGESSQITPIGTITSNVAQLSLWNGEGRYANDNPLSEFRGMIEPNVIMNLEYIYEVNGTTYPVQQFKMYVSKWSDSEESEMNLELSDASKFLKEDYPNPAKYENLKLAQIVYRLLDSMGFTDYDVNQEISSSDFRIPIFWVDGTKTLWEVFDDLATATQSLIFFDAFGKLNIRPREAAYSKSRPVDWTLRGQKSGTELADIVSVDDAGEYESNVIKVNYRSAKWSDETNGHPQLTTVWSPEDTLTLRATQLAAPLSQTADYISIASKEAAHWPFEGHVQIEGEFIEYSGKWFKYRDNNTWKQQWVYSQKEYDECHEKTPSNLRFENHFLGRLKIKERAVWNSELQTHDVNAKGWSGKRFNLTPNTSSSSNQFHSWRKAESTMRLNHGGKLTLSQFAMVTRGANNDSGFRHFGTRLRFNGGALQHRGGIMFNNRDKGEGYLVQLRPTNSIPNSARATEDEITIFSVKNGKWHKVGSGIRRSDTIIAGLWTDLDVYYDWATHAISIFLNGRFIFKVVVPSAMRHAPGGKFGMWIRGTTSVDFEYLYAVAREPSEPADEPGFYDRVTGGYVGDKWAREWVYKNKTKSKTRYVKRKGKKKKIKTNVKFRKNQYFFDEFGPYVHEVREFDVKFDPAPVAHSRLMLTNDWDIICPEYRATPFGAYFILANASRRNAVASGGDELTFGASGEVVEQELKVYGRNVVISEQEEVEVRNEDQIRARGEIVGEIDSDWIQSQEAAQAVADWISDHWSSGADELNVEAFGNPLLELGDVVSIDYPVRRMGPTTHQYFVTGIETAFDSGISTSLTLRRRS